LFEINLRLNKIDYVWKEFQSYMANQDKLFGELTDSCINALLDKFFDASQIDRVFSVLELAIQLRLPSLPDFVIKLEQHPGLESEKR
jgi:hypothetical protein